MKKLVAILCLAFTAHYGVMAQTEIVLGPYESMLMTGKGPGQDATINPFEGQDCFAIVKNIGEKPFSIRVQEGEKIIEEIAITEGETKRIKLLKTYQLYLDPTTKGTAKASVDYEKIED